MTAGWKMALAAFAAAQCAITGACLAEDITFEGARWRVDGPAPEIVEHRGRKALALNGGKLWRDDVSLADGVVEFDASFSEAASFFGAMFRARDDGNYEDFYLRAHLSGKPDATQYTPQTNGVSAWQIFADARAQAAVEHDFDGWNRIKIVMIGDAADIYVNSAAPVLHVPDLKTGIGRGGVGLWGFSLDGGDIRLSNFSARPLRDGETLIGAPAEASAPPAGVIMQWEVSTAFAEATIADALTVPAAATRGLSWRRLDAETNGVANLAKAARLSDGADTVFVRLRVKSDADRVASLRFGYSDRARIYVNGKLAFAGDAGWKSRDYRFLGTVGFHDTAGLDLKHGDNEILIAVSETFGGWAWAGAMENRDGLHILPTE